MNPAMYAKFGLKGHDGIDIACPTGTEIVSPCDGWVVGDDFNATTYGNKVSILGTDNFLHLLGHTSSDIYAGNTQTNLHDRSRPIKAGDKVALSGNTGNSTGPHCHWGVYEYDENLNKLNANNGFFGAIDPRIWLAKGNTMKLVKDGNTVFIVAGDKNKVKIGLGDEATLALFGDEPLNFESTNGITETHTLASGFVIHNK
jgi:murein DD-endopeptidase MepM/ murein hydrolase activator NlpD